jgi:carboxylesterase
MRGDPAPFDFGGDRRGVLCLHGFTGTPFEMRYLGERLHQRGFTAVGPALPGHVATPEALDATTWRDWTAGVDAAFDALRRRCDRVAVVGMSLGGALALHLARRRGAEVAAIATLGAPLWLPRLGRLIAALYRHTPIARVLAGVPKLGGGSDIRDPVMRAANPSYPSLPGRAVVQLDEFLRVVRGDVPLVRAPALVIHARQDHSVPYACSRALAREIGAERVRHRALPGSYHVISIDIERDIVADEVGRFFETHLGEMHLGNAA